MLGFCVGNNVLLWAGNSQGSTADKPQCVGVTPGKPSCTQYTSCVVPYCLILNDYRLVTVSIMQKGYTDAQHLKWFCKQLNQAQADVIQSLIRLHISRYVEYKTPTFIRRLSKLWWESVSLHGNFVHISMELCVFQTGAHGTLERINQM